MPLDPDNNPVHWVLLVSSDSSRNRILVRLSSMTIGTKPIRGEPLSRRAGRLHV